MSLFRSTLAQGSEFAFEGCDGTRIECWRWGDHSPGSAVVQIAHGLGEHVGHYADLAATLVAAGFVVYGNDHRGHGRSAAEADALGKLGDNGFELIVEDMCLLLRRIRAERPRAPVIVLGHGLGSFAAQELAIQCSDAFDGLALGGCATLDGWSLAVQGSADEIEYLKAVLGPDRAPFYSLGSAGLAADPLCFDDLNLECLDALAIAAALTSDPVRLRQIRKDLPIYMRCGEDRGWQCRIGLDTLAHRYQSAGLHNVTHHYHDFTGDHVKSAVDDVAALLSWMLDVVAECEADAVA